MTQYFRSMTIAATVLVFLLPQAVSMAATGPTDQRHSDHRRTPKLVFAPDFVARGVTDPVGIAKAYLAAEHEIYTLPTEPEDLRLERIRRSLLGTHVTFQQYLDGTPVEGGQIIVSVGDDGRILRVFNNTYPVTRRPDTLKAAIDGNQALDIAWTDLRVHGELLDATPFAELAYVPMGTGFRLVYLTEINVAAPHGSWQHRIDALSGDVLGVKRLDIPRKKEGNGKFDFQSYKGPLTDRIEAQLLFSERESSRDSAPSGARATVDGTGQVFAPDPKTSLADAGLLDTSSASTFNPAYFTKTLSEITETSGTYSLSGPWVEIIDFEAPATAPSTTNDGIWTAVRGNNAFNDTMTYYQIDLNQRYMQGLGFTGATAIQNGPIETDTDGFNGDDNSHYFPSSNRLGFGHGGVDDNEDADVILHEYMHGITHDINPSWGGADTGAMGEGFGDYWGGSYSYSTPNGPTFHPEWAFSWDGHGSDTWPGRVMNLSPANSQYDPGCTYAAHSSCGGVSGDELWSTPIFQALVELIGMGPTREEVDTIILEGQFGLGANLKMPDMANAIVSAAQTLYPTGPHAGVFQTKFSDHNILDLPAVATPTLTSPTGGSVVQAGGTIDITWNTGGAPGTTVYTVEYTDQCTPNVFFEDDMESGGAAWTATHGSGSVDWTLATTSPHSGTTSWFATEPTTVADQYLATTSSVAVPSGATLTFWHSYDVESTYDGGAVEISTNAGSTWTDLGADMTQNGYNGTISSSYSNPIGGRQAFTGSSSGYMETVVDLSAYAGTNALVRFRMATDTSVNVVGWWVDDVSIATTGTWTNVGVSAAGASSLQWNVPAVSGTDYCIRISAAAPGYSPSQGQGAIFEVGNAEFIFADDFESGGSTAWSVTTP